MAPYQNPSTMMSNLSARLSSILQRSPSPESPMNAAARFLARDSSTKYNPGSGIINPATINNNVFFVLFALIGAGLVITSIWFFFWAKNGSFRFRKGDWDDYKTTVLRRKGPNGTILSGATRTTALGGGSVVGSTGSISEFTDDPEKAMPAVPAPKKNRFRKSKNNDDNDVRAYRTEKPARVGGLNREADGYYQDVTNSEMSEVSGARPTVTKVPGSKGKSPAKRYPPTRQMSYSAGTEATFSVASDDSHRPLTSSPQHQQHRYSASSTPNGSPRHARQPSPTKRASGTPRDRHSGRVSGMPGSYAEPLDFDSRYDGSDAGTEQSKNTKAYFHPIPGLSKPAGAGGFRRGGAGRRDSLSDSDGETRRT